jgi:4-alpha-glucanotransferase
MKNYRSSGLLMHISSLTSKFGIGDFGPTAYDFAELLKKNKQHYWQILPLNPTELKHGNSPYFSYSAFAGNPLFISPVLLYQDGLLAKDDLENYYLPEGIYIDFPKVYPLKEKILVKTCDNFKRKNIFQHEFEGFCQNQSFWLDDYVLFEVLRYQFPQQKWNEWPARISERKRGALKSLTKKMEIEIKNQKIIQFLFYRQWNKLKDYCISNKIKIIGDMPIYVTHNSADVWSNPELFKLDDNKSPSFVAGVPPDYFSKTGQLWGNPVYNWPAHRKKDFDWWKRRISHNLTIVDLLRIDHFRGLVAYWEVPAFAKTAIRGKWVTGGGNSFFKKLKQSYPNLPFIAEDLGVITEDVERIIKKLGLPGMRVLQFGFDEKNFPYNMHLPHDYIKNCVAYTGTHDNNTIQGWLQKEINKKQKRLLRKYMGKNFRLKNAHWEFIRMTLASVAQLAIIPIQDILGLGDEARMNYPSHTDSNWQWRLTIEKMTEMKDYALPKLKELTQIYGRENT